MHLSVSHELDAVAARAAVDKAFAHYRSRYGSYKPALRWLGDERAELSFSAKGVVLRGTLTMHPGRLVLDAKVPLLLKPFTKKAVAKIESELAHWLGDGKRIEGA